MLRVSLDTLEAERNPSLKPLERPNTSGCGEKNSLDDRDISSNLAFRVSFSLRACSACTFRGHSRSLCDGSQEGCCISPLNSNVAICIKAQQSNVTSHRERLVGIDARITVLAKALARTRDAKRLCAAGFGRRGFAI